MVLGQEYTISVLGYEDEGEWILDGFHIMKGSTTDKTIVVLPTKSGTLHLSFKVNGMVVKERPFYVK